MADNILPHFHNATGVDSIAIGVREFMCIGALPPFDHPHVIAGQGTAAKELIEDAGPLDLLLVPCGGGGLLSGCALAARRLLPDSGRSPRSPRSRRGM